MNRLLKAAAELLCAVGLSAYASTSNATATLTDSDSTAWANCSWSAVISSPTPPTINGTPVPDSQLRANGACSASGVLSATMLDTSSVDQAGVTWTFTIAPNASVAPSVVSGVAVTGASPNLSSVLSAGIKASRFNPGTSAYGYADAEVTNPVLGSTYFNTGTVCGASSLRQYSNIGWACGSSPATSPTGSAKPKGRSGSAESIYYQTLADGSVHAWLMSANKAVWVDQVNQDVVYAGSATLMGVTNAYEMNEETGTTLHDSVGTTELNFYSTAPTWNGRMG